MNVQAARIVETLGLIPLPHEGGFFAPTWSSAAELASGRRAGSAIYFLVTPAGFSALHRLRTGEVWCFHAGDPVDHCQLGNDGRGTKVTRLGADVLHGQTPQVAVNGGVWQGARLALDGAVGWALMSCFMAPAWDEREFELGSRADLLREFPAASVWIHGLTRLEAI